MKVEHAVIMAAGLSSRFAPLSHELPKALVEVRGEVLIERQIEQLLEAGVPSIVVVTGYLADQLDYLARRYPLRLIHNPDYATRNNNGSLLVARDYLRNAYLCSADNYFAHNPFSAEVDGAYYAVVYADGPTDEWCVEADETGRIRAIEIGGRDSWYMLGHCFFDRAFADGLLAIMEAHEAAGDYHDLLWEGIYRLHLDELAMRVRPYEAGTIFEFDSIDELRRFDSSYVDHTRSAILAQVAAELGLAEAQLEGFQPLQGEDAQTAGFRFLAAGRPYRYRYAEGQLSAD